MKIRDFLLPFTAIVFVSIGVLTVTYCEDKRPSEKVFSLPTPSPSPVTSVVSSSNSVFTQNVSVSIRKSPVARVKNKTTDNTFKIIKAPKIASNEVEQETKGEDITVEITQSMMATTSVVNLSSPQVAQTSVTDSQKNLGVIVGIIPGAVALDYKVAKVNSVQVDVEGNFSEVGAGVSYGEILFGTVGAYHTYSGSNGIYAAFGCRF